MSSDGASLDTLREQVVKLDALHAAGVLGDDAHREARAALERRIVDAVVNASPAAPAAAPAATSASTPARPSGKLLAGLVLGVAAVAGVGYALVGRTPASGTAPVATDAAAPPAAAASGGGHPITSAQIESMIEKLAARLKDKPDDADGWAMLGRSYAMVGKHALALPALKRAVEGRPTDAALIADVADAMAVVAGGKLEGEPAALIERALKADPDNPKALSLAGTIAFDRKDYAGALRHWDHLAQVAPTSDFVKQIQGGIDEARSLLQPGSAASGATAAAPAAPVAPAGKSAISGTITLSKALAGKAKPDDTLFVFARAAEGPRMPLAILRKQVKDLPLTFTLDDSMAMAPNMTLSTATRVVVGARISQRGDATAQAGDLQVISAPMAPGATGLKLEISEVVGP